MKNDERRPTESEWLEISKSFTTTEKGKRRNQARTALQTLISNGFIHTGSEDGKDYIWI